MNMKKKLVAGGLVAALAATAIGGATLAYFTDDDSATNNFTVGNVTIDLTEPKWDETGKVEAEDAYPGEALAKDPTVENTGANPAFVAVKVDWPVVDGIDTAVSTRYQYVDGYNTTDWTKVKDVIDENNKKVVSSIYLYNAYLDTGATTAPVFDQIVVSKDFTNENAGGEAGHNVVVTAYALQAQGIVGPSWSNVTDGIDATEQATILNTMSSEFEWGLTF